MYGKSNPAVRGCLRDDMLDGPEELYTLDAYSRLSNYFGDTEGTRLVGEIGRASCRERVSSPV